MNTRPTQDDGPAAGNPTDEAAVRDLFRRLLDDWGRGNGQAYGSRFTEDAVRSPTVTNSTPSPTRSGARS